MSRRGKKSTLRERVSRQSRRRKRRELRVSKREAEQVTVGVDVGDETQRALRNAFCGIHPLSAEGRMNLMYVGQMRRTRARAERKRREELNLPTRKRTTRRGLPKRTKEEANA